MGKSHISMKSISRACSHEPELGPRAETVSLGAAGEDGAPNSNLSKLPELYETSRAMKLIFGLQVNIDKANSRRYHVAVWLSW